MKDPAYALFLPSDAGLRDLIESGQISAVILPGHVEYRAGPVVLCMPEHGWIASARIDDVQRTRADRLSHAALYAAGFAPSRDGMAAGRRADMPAIGPRARVTFVGWTDITNPAIEHRKLRSR